MRAPAVGPGGRRGARGRADAAPADLGLQAHPVAARSDHRPGPARADTGSRRSVADGRGGCHRRDRRRRPRRRRARARRGRCGIRPAPKLDEVHVTVRGRGVDDVLAELRDAGLEVDQALGDLGIVTGRAAPDAVERMRGLPRRDRRARERRAAASPGCPGAVARGVGGRARPDMEITHLNPDALFTNPAFSQGVLVSGERRTRCYVGGQNGTDAAGEIVEGGLGAQTEQALAQRDGRARRGRRRPVERRAHGRLRRRRAVGRRGLRRVDAGLGAASDRHHGAVRGGARAPRRPRRDRGRPPPSSDEHPERHPGSADRGDRRLPRAPPNRGTAARADSFGNSCMTSTVDQLQPFMYS